MPAAHRLNELPRDLATARANLGAATGKLPPRFLRRSPEGEADAIEEKPRRCPSKVVDEGNIAPLEGVSGDDESAGTLPTAQLEMVELSVVEVVARDGVTVVTFR